MPADNIQPSERRLRARLAAHTSWAKTEDRGKRTQPARDTFAKRFEHEVDPDGVLTLEERCRRAESARKAYFTKLALRSAQVRRRRAASDRTES